MVCDRQSPVSADDPEANGACRRALPANRRWKSLGSGRHQELQAGEAVNSGQLPCLQLLALLPLAAAAPGSARGFNEKPSKEKGEQAVVSSAALVSLNSSHFPFS